MQRHIFYEGTSFYGRTGYADGVYKDYAAVSFNDAGRMSRNNALGIQYVGYNTMGLPEIYSKTATNPTKAPHVQRYYDARGTKIYQKTVEAAGGL